MSMGNPTSMRFAANIERLLRHRQSAGSAGPDSPESTAAPGLEHSSAPSRNDVQGAFEGALKRAALSGTFDPNDIVDAAVGDSERTAILSRLAPLCEVRKEGPKMRWLLQVAHRTPLLEDLAKGGTLPSLLSGALPETDRFGDVLRSLLSGSREVVEVDSLPVESLLTIASVREAVSSLSLPKFDDLKLKRRIGHARFLADYDGLLEGGFLGRQKQREALHAFVRGDAAAGSTFASALLTGLGGAGKSTLVAKFAQEVVEQGTATLAVLDFDRPGIDPSDTYWLEMEINRQVAFQFPDKDDELRALRESARRTKKDADRATKSSSSEYAHLERVFRSVIEGTRYALVSTPAGIRPLVLVLDTFEEVAQRDLTPKIVNWLRELADALHPLILKVIYSGRLFDQAVSELKQYGATTTIPLEDLTADEAHQLLVNQGLSGDWASKLANSDVFPRRPLELKLLAKLVAADNVNSIEELEQELRLGGAATRELFAGLVYRRVLQRVREDIRPLASPGLVLRYLDADIVEHVLLPVLRPSGIGPAEAQTALNTLARYEWLTYRQGDEVWHRKDLRRSMLKVMVGGPTHPSLTPIDPSGVFTQESEVGEVDQVRAIHEAAIRFFEQRADARSQAEATYHRLMLSDSPESLAAINRRELRTASEYIASDIVDLPAAAQALLRFSAGRDLSIEDVSLLPEQYRPAAYEDLGERYVSGREFGLAAKLLALPGAPRRALRSWEAEALFETARWDKLRFELKALNSRDYERGRDAIGQRDATYLTAVVAPGRLPSMSPELLEAIWPGSESHSGPDNTALERAAMTLTLAHARSPFARPMEQALRAALRPLDSRPREQSDLPQRRVFLLDHITGQPSEAREIALTPLTIKFSIHWLYRMRTYSRSFVGDSSVLERLESFLKAATQTLERTTNTNARVILGEMARLPTQGVWFSPCRFGPKELISLFSGPQPEFRNPTRFALLDAFSTPVDYEDLRGVLGKSIPLAVADLEAARFRHTLAGDAEHSLEAFVALADCCGVLGRLLRNAHRSRPDAVQISRVAGAYNRWKRAERYVLRSSFTKQLETARGVERTN